MHPSRFLIGAMLGLLLASAWAVKPPEAATASGASSLAGSVPGPSAIDPYPNACVDCHVNDAERQRDMRLSTILAALGMGVPQDLLSRAQVAAPAGVELQGWHPSVKVAADIPGKCLTCHGRDSGSAPPFARLMHAIHLIGGEENAFLAEFQGACTHCHKLDSTTARWGIPSAPEN